MRNEKKDLRSKYTQNIIKKTLVEMLKSKDINQITVSELCNEAGINRGTFYNHFYDVKDVYNTISDEFYKKIVEIADDEDIHALDRTFYHKILPFVAEYSDFVLFITTDKNNVLAQKIVLHLKENYIREFTVMFPKLSQDYLNHLFIFSITGSIAIVNDWIKKGMKTPIDSITSDIDEFATSIWQHSIKQRI